MKNPGMRGNTDASTIRSPWVPRTRNSLSTTAMRSVGGPIAHVHDAWPERGGGGVLRSAYTNKMNEVKPHRAWAERTVLRAEVFGVANEDVGFVELLAAGIPG